MNLISLFPVAMMIALSVICTRALKISGERAFSSLMAGSFFGIFSWFFSAYFLSGFLFLLGGALLDSLIKAAGVNLRKDKRYSLFFGFGFGFAISFLSLFYSSTAWPYSILFATSAMLFHAATSILAFSSETLKPVPRLFFFSFLYNVMLLLNSWISISIALIFGGILFRHYYDSLSEV